VSASKPHPEHAAPHPDPLPAKSGERGKAGFTLLEALIAITVLALSLSALLSLYSTGLRGVAAIDGNMRARLLAQSVMAEMSHERASRPGKVQGRSDQFTWTLTVAPYDEPERGQQRSPWTLHHLVVTVSWPHGRQIELQTLRMLRSQ
jgi:general secretion pathway protein I